ncbi:MAG: polysaccharide pyruvyl transferase family protein [Clostridiaceae bacterium]|nr:polysaccharide pyruvyl transferase family protein [Clostridiaceae bacterium]
MKAGILTFHYAHHYGAQLQAYALMRAIEMLGMKCEIINYVRKDNIEGSRIFKKGLSAGSLLANANTLMNYGKLKRRHERYDLFVQEKMKLSERFYGSYEELCADPPEYDAYVCGSDQIWNPLIFGEKTYDPAFFAEFAQCGRRVAYAPSFGISSIPEDKRELLKKYIEKFDHLSVREKHGEKILKEVTGRDSITVLDPTLLLTMDEWSTVAAVPDIREPYILCYFITDARKYTRHVQAVSDKYRLPVVTLCGSRRVVPQTRYKVLDAGPCEFLGLFAGASAVMTDSFHGTVFSLNYNKEFFCFESSASSEKAVNSRLHNILDKVGLLPRIFSATDAKEFCGFVSDNTTDIDYSEVGRILAKERSISLKYLKDSLS